MKKLLSAVMVAALLAGLACSASTKATNEVKALLDNSAKGMMEANELVIKATDAKGVVSGLDKFISVMKELQTKGAELDKKYPDANIRKSKEAEVNAALDKFQKATETFTNSMTATLPKYASDPDVMAKVGEMQSVGN